MWEALRQQGIRIGVGSSTTSGERATPECARSTSPTAIPPEQVGHSVGEPDAVAHELAEIPAIVAGLCSA